MKIEQKLILALVAIILCLEELTAIFFSSRKTAGNRT